MFFHLGRIVLVSHRVLLDFYLNSKSYIKNVSLQIWLEWFFLITDLHNSRKPYFVSNVMIKIFMKVVFLASSISLASSRKIFELMIEESCWIPLSFWRQGGHAHDCVLHVRTTLSLSTQRTSRLSLRISHEDLLLFPLYRWWKQGSESHHDSHRVTHRKWQKQHKHALSDLCSPPFSPTHSLQIEDRPPYDLSSVLSFIP